MDSAVLIKVANNPKEMATLVADGRFVIISVVMVENKGYVTCRKVTWPNYHSTLIVIHGIDLQATDSEKQFEGTARRSHVMYRHGSIYRVEVARSCE